MEDKMKEALEDDLLESVSGGLKTQILGRKQTKTCDKFECVWCGHRKSRPMEETHICNPQGKALFANVCNECVHLNSCSNVCI